MTPWTAAYQAPPSMGFSRQEYWSGVPLPSLINKLPCIKQTVTEDLVDSTGSSAWCSVKTWRGRVELEGRFKREGYIYTCR